MCFFLQNSSTSNWKTYTPLKLETFKHITLKVTKTNVSENKKKQKFTSNYNSYTMSTTSTMALHSSHISKEYSDLAEIKMKLGYL